MYIKTPARHRTLICRADQTISPAPPGYILSRSPPYAGGVYLWAWVCSFRLYLKRLDDGSRTVRQRKQVTAMSLRFILRFILRWSCDVTAIVLSIPGKILFLRPQATSGSINTAPPKTGSSRKEPDSSVPQPADGGYKDWVDLFMQNFTIEVENGTERLISPAPNGGPNQYRLPRCDGSNACYEACLTVDRGAFLPWLLCFGRCIVILFYLFLFCCLGGRCHKFEGNMTASIHRLLCGNLQLNL